MCNFSLKEFGENYLGTRLNDLKTSAMRLANFGDGASEVSMHVFHTRYFSPPSPNQVV